MRKYIFYFISIIICATGDALIFKANIGANPWEAMCQTFHYITYIKVGTIMACINSSTILLEILLLKKVHWYMLIQVVASCLFGSVVNFIIYLFLKDVVFNQYIIMLLLGIAGIIISATGNALMMKSDVAAFPFEGMCEILGKKINVSFARVRQMFDICFIIISIVLCTMNHFDYTVRELTILSMLIYSPIMAYVMKIKKQ